MIRLVKVQFQFLFLLTLLLFPNGYLQAELVSEAAPCVKGFGLVSVDPAPQLFVQDILARGSKLATQSKRLVGVEAEFGGLRNRSDIEELAAKLNGTVEWKEGMDKAPKGKQTIAYIRGSEIGDVRIEDEGISREQMNDGQDPNVISDEHGDHWKMGIEMVTDPMPPEHRAKYTKLVSHLKDKKVKSITDGWTTGIHVNVDATGITPPRLRKLLLWWAKNHSNVYGNFKPSPLRSIDGKPFYGPFSKEFIEELKTLSSKDCTLEDIRRVANRHYASNPERDNGFGEMQKFIDINMNPIFGGYGHYLEFRLFNADFHESSNPRDTQEAIDFCASAVELAARDLLPE